MPETTIYGSSGNIRYPADVEPLQHDEKEAIRDLFFDSVHLKYDGSSLKMFFEASTGSPEQFIGEYSHSGTDISVENAHEQLVETITAGMGWTVPDSNTSSGHQLFRLLPEIEPIQPTQYPLSTIENVAETTKMDFAVSDLRIAVGFLKWLVQNTETNPSIAIASDGRSRSLSNTDIVVTTADIDQNIKGIDGTHETLRDTATAESVDVTTGLLDDYITNIGSNHPNSPAKALVELLRKDPFRVNHHNFIAQTRDEQGKERHTNEKYIGGAAGVIGFVAAFAYAGGFTNIGRWWNQSIIGTDTVQLGLVSAMDSLTAVELPYPPAIGVVIASILLTVCWTAAIYLFFSRSGSSSAAGQPPEPSFSVPDYYYQELSNVVQSVEGSELVTMEEHLERLSKEIGRVNDDVVLESLTSNRVSRVRWAAIPLLFAGGISSGVGYLIGRSTAAILEQWVTVSEFIIVLSIGAFVPLVFLFVIKFILGR
jgi:hypothetical protein